MCKKTSVESSFSLRSCAKPEHHTTSLIFLELRLITFSQSKKKPILLCILIQTPKDFRCLLCDF